MKSVPSELAKANANEIVLYLTVFGIAGFLAITIIILSLIFH